MKYRHYPVNSPLVDDTHCHGDVTVDSPFGRSELEAEGTQTVTFTPGSKTCWHSHPLEQTVIVRSGEGLLQLDGQPLESVHAGDIIRIPADTRHWLGATGGQSLVCMLVTNSIRGHAVTWEEPILV